MASVRHFVLQPVSSKERVHYIDVLRGFALYGVLLANLVWFVCDMVLTPVAAGQLPTHAMDRIVKYLVVFFIDGKFITLFAFLFAVGFTIQMQRALQSGRNGLAIYARRVTVLLVIGAVHIVFIWFGDNLFMYSLLGFVLLLVRKWRPGISMLVVACLLILLARVTFISVQQVRDHDRPAQIAASHPDEAQQQQTLAAFRGSYASVIRRNVAIYWGDLFIAGLVLVMLLQVFGRFLLGLYVGKREYIYHVAEYTPLLRRALPWLLLVACAGNGASVAQEWAQHTLRLPPTTTWMVVLRPLMEAGGLPLRVLCGMDRLAASVAIVGTGGCPTRAGGPHGPDQLPCPQSLLFVLPHGSRSRHAWPFRCDRLSCPQHSDIRRSSNL